MALTYVNLATTTLGSATNVVTFSSISSSYTDLAVRWSARCDSAVQRIRLTFNGSSATEYSENSAYGDGSNPSSTASSNAAFTNIWFGMNSSAYTASTFSNGELYIPNYTSSGNKPSLTDTATENDSTEAFRVLGANLWRNTSAISSITFTTNSGNFVSGSSFYLYGIKKD